MLNYEALGNFTIILIFHQTCIFSTFGVGMLRLLKEYALSVCCPGYEVQGDLPEVAWKFYQDLSFVVLVYSPRNIGRFASAHPHFQDAYDSMERNKMNHQFCSKCDDVNCIVNSTMLRAVYVCMYYLEQVSLLSWFYFAC